MIHHIYQTPQMMFVSESMRRARPLRHDGIPSVIIEEYSNEKAVLKRYDEIFRTVITKNYRCSYIRLITADSQHSKDKGEVMNGIGGAVGYGMRDADRALNYFSTFFNLVTTQASLFVVLNIQLFISPPDFAIARDKHIFCILIGSSGLLELFVVLLCLFLYVLTSGPMRQLEKYILCLRMIQAGCALAFAVDAFAVLLTIASTCFIAFVRVYENADIPMLDGYSLLWAPIMFVSFFVAAYFTIMGMDEHGDVDIVYNFYLKYCEPNGELRSEFINQIYG
jgi:hypothetical protein